MTSGAGYDRDMNQEPKNLSFVGVAAFVVLFAFDLLLRGVDGSDLGAARCRDARRALTCLFALLGSFHYSCCLIHFSLPFLHTRMQDYFN
jgi:hypothetical protein